MGYEDEPLRPSSKGKLSPVSVLLCALVPPLVFMSVYALLSFEFRHNLGLAIASKFPMEASLAAHIAAFVIGVLPFLIVTSSLLSLGYFRMKKGKLARTPLCLGACLGVATIGGYVFGDRNYWTYLATYYNIQDLETYINIDPTKDRGQSFMDAGQAYFKESTTVAVGNANAFRNNGVYCVAPIVRQPLGNQGGSNQVETQGVFKLPESGTVDFWAVGVNCCEPTGLGFNCGDVKNPSARAGLRLIRDDQRAFFLLAVQEWAAKYGLPTKHPLFFYWVVDPLAESDGMRLKGTWKFYTHIILFAIANFVLCLALQFVCQKYGIN